MSDIYIPTGAFQLNNPNYNFQRRIGLQGYGGTGKSHAFTTFDNPAFLSFDRGLISHLGRPDIIEIPFYDPSYVDKIRRRAGTQQPPNRKDALIDFLSGEALKFTRNQTFILDASTGIQAAYHQWWEVNKDEYTTTTGAVDARKEWNLKLKYFQEIMVLLKALKCDVGYICHEMPDRDDKGNLTGGVRPLLTGQFQDELMTHFTDWFRCHAIPKPQPEKMDAFKKAFGLNEATAKEWLATGTESTIYVWQTQSDNVAKCKTSMIGAPKYVLAHADTFKKYKGKVPEGTI